MHLSLSELIIYDTNYLGCTYLYHSRVKSTKKKNIYYLAPFGTHTKEKKCQAWIEIADFAKSVCLIPRDKEWTLAGDVLWQNIKKATMAKRDYHQNSERRNGKL
ncbi:hypothetical protein Anas_13231 [Armadillidium nasatum]|uniref:Uncharacterized protein n=1 Tax=Armadillidium nasatum TaxID=96803 RepID=A0A5N5T4T0_9CRUS|nr:hypothetical protein Anas_13231 [Armadillidium nasatum]